MATRADRLNERLRGAQRTNVDDEDTFGLDLDLGIPGISIPPPATAPEPAAPEPSPPSSAAKRRKLNPPASQPQPAQRSASRSVERTLPSRTRQASNVPSIPEEPEVTNGAARLEPNNAGRSPSRKRSIVTREEALSVLKGSPPPRFSQEVVEEEVEESPKNAPGSGKRRRVTNTEVASASSARLRDAMEQESSPAPMSSPSAQRQRRSTAGRSTLGAVQETAEGEEPEEPTPVARVLRSATKSASRSPSVQVEEATPVAGKKGRGRPRKGASTVSPDLGSPSKERRAPQEVQTEETPVPESASRKRGRPPRPVEPSPPTRRQPGRAAAVSKSPAQSPEIEQEEEEEEEEQPPSAAKPRGRRPKNAAASKPPAQSPEAAEEEEEQPPSAAKPKGRLPKSPAVQRQPANRRRSPRISRSPNETVKSRQPKPKTKKPAAKPQAKPQARSRSSNVSNTSQTPDPDDDDAAIEITVQRYVNNTEDDPLSAPLPFANRSATSTVDVLAQICGEVISHTLDQLLDLLSRTTDAKKKKEYRIKMRAIDAYREELQGRLLQHAIYLDHWHGLRRRVRAVQKERGELRAEIVKLRAEREGVGLRMDALRDRHDEEVKESKYRLDASAMMHDIELAVERGQEAPKLSPKQQKEAELANLEFMVAQVADQASSKSATGGLHKQLADFNAFLERAAVALEGKV